MLCQADISRFLLGIYQRFETIKPGLAKEYVQSQAPVEFFLFTFIAPVS
jgi:hypothetical protein